MAVAVAEAALPTGHPPISEIEFRFGSWCGIDKFCPIDLQTDVGYVIFHTDGRVPDLWVTMRADSSGVPELTSEIGPFPPPD